MSHKTFVLRGPMPTLPVLLILALLLPLTAHAAGYLKLGDIKGESRADDYRDKIEFMSWSWGATNAAAPTTRDAASGMATGRRRHQPLTIIKRVDKASPKLQQANASGTRFASMTLSLPNPDPAQGYLKYKLDNVMITSYQINASGADSTETVTFTYTKISESPAAATRPARAEGD